MAAWAVCKYKQLSQAVTPGSPRALRPQAYKEDAAPDSRSLQTPHLVFLFPRAGMIDRRQPGVTGLSLGDTLEREAPVGTLCRETAPGHSLDQSRGRPAYGRQPGFQRKEAWSLTRFHPGLGVRALVGKVFQEIGSVLKNPLWRGNASAQESRQSTSAIGHLPGRFTPIPQPP